MSPEGTSPDPESAEAASLYGKESELTPGLHSIALAEDAHREALKTIMSERGLTEAEARLELLKHVDPEAVDERRSLERRLEVDSLTGVGNQLALNKAKESAERDPDTAFISFDLNNFGNYNKITSQDAGDALIQDAARRMTEAMAELGLPPRVFRRADAGDEFVVIAPRARAEEVRDKIEAAIGAQEFTGTYQGAEKTVVVSISGEVGATLAESQEGMQARKVEHKTKFGGETTKLPDA